MGGKERVRERLRARDQFKAEVVWSEAYQSILELPTRILESSEEGAHVRYFQVA